MHQGADLNDLGDENSMPFSNVNVFPIEDRAMNVFPIEDRAMIQDRKMPSLATLRATILLLMVLVQAVSSAPDTRVVTVLCNGAAYTAGDPFAISLAYVLADLQATTPSYKAHDYYDISPFPNAFAYGHAACTASLSAPDCTTCLRAAAAQMNSSCPMKIGARCSLVDCKIRYEQYPFV